jgi:hypothetical protein
MRIISKQSKRDSSFPIFQTLNIFPVQHLFIYKVLKIFYERSGNMGTENLFYTTRNVNLRKFRTPKVNKSHFRNSFVFLGPAIFNRIPLQLKLSPNLKLFCKKVGIWLFNISDVRCLREIII